MGGADIDPQTLVVAAAPPPEVDPEADGALLLTMQSALPPPPLLLTMQQAIAPPPLQLTMAQALSATPAPAPDERFYDPRVYVDQITDILTDRRVESSKVAQAEKVESAPSAGADRTLVASAGSTTSEAPIPALEIVPVEAELLGDGDYIPLTPAIGSASCRERVCQYV